MVDSRTFPMELWVILGLYMGVLLLAIARAMYMSLSRDKPQGAFVEHYLAGRSLGPITMGVSLMASQFSGYTCVGIPAEAYKDGFSAWRWPGSTLFAALVYLAYSPRLQWLARARGYDSMLSFIQDRYAIRDQRKDPYHWFMVIIVFIPCLIYLFAQFLAFSATIETLSNGNVTRLQASIGLAVLIALYEILGGLRAVAATDVIQGTVLVLGSLCILFFMDTTFGGLPELSEKLEDISPSHVQVMSPDKSLSWAEFWIGVGIQRALFPDYPQRAMAAASQTSLRIGTAILCFSPFLVQVPLLFFGLVGRVYHPNLSDAKEVFTTVVLDIIERDQAGRIIGSLVMAASVAAIMSTADSVLIILSQLLTLDCIRPCRKGPEGTEGAESGSCTVIAGRIVTLIIAAVCVPIVGGKVDLSFMIQFQSAILMQVFPTFVIALYWRGLHKWASFAGTFVGVVCGVALLIAEVNGGILIAFGCNLVITLLVAVALSHKAAPVDEKHAEFLELISWRPPREAAKAFLHKPCVREPMSHNWLMMVVALILPWFAIPFYRKAGLVETVYLSGSPAWAVTSVMVLLAEATLLVYIIVYNWAGPEDEVTSAADADVDTKHVVYAGDGPSSQEISALRDEIKDLKDKVEDLSSLKIQVRDTIREEVAALFH